MKRLILFFALAYFSAGSLIAQQPGWKLDKAHSSIGFTVRHMVISEVTGNFKEFDVNFTSATDDFSDAAVEATVKVASVNTDNDRRDGHLKTDEFFNAEKFPQIKFKSTSFEKVVDNKYKITGDLTMRDVTKKVTFEAVYNGSIKAPWGATVSSWKATASVNRFDYGLKWNKTIENGGLIAGDIVTITLNLELNKPSAS